MELTAKRNLNSDGIMIELGILRSTAREPFIRQ